MKNPHKQFPGKMDKTTKKEYKKGYKIAKHGNVPDGYRKLKHVKLFENFDSQTPEMEGAVVDAIGEIFPTRKMAMKAYAKDSDAFYAEIVAQVKSDTGMTDEDAITDALDNWFISNESGKWFVAQEGEERFKFQAKDMDEAKEYASKTWNAEVVGEVDEEMEFEDTPMDETDESTVNEGSYTDFLTSHGNDLRKAVKQIKEIAAVYDDQIESKAVDIDKAMLVYDENVDKQIERWILDSNISTDKIAKFAIENQDKYGTEPWMVLDAIDDFHKIMK